MNAASPWPSFAEVYRDNQRVRRQASIDGPLDASFLASPDDREASWYLNRQSKSDDSLVFWIPSW